MKLFSNSRAFAPDPHQKLPNFTLLQRLLGLAGDSPEELEYWMHITPSLGEVRTATI